jgi:hypothetical protein
LTRICLSAHFTTEEQLETFVDEQLPDLDYLEISSVVLSDKLIVSASKRLK